MEKLEFVRIEKFNYEDDDKKNYLPESLLVKFMVSGTTADNKDVLYYRKTDVDKYKNEIEQLKQQIRVLEDNRKEDKNTIEKSKEESERYFNGWSISSNYAKKLEEDIVILKNEIKLLKKSEEIIWKVLKCINPK